MQLDELKNQQDIIDAIDWDMTPEEAVRLYLEWGNNWTRGNYVIRSKNDVAHYFVVNTWDKKPRIYLIRRNSEEAKELAEIHMPEDIMATFLEANGNNKGVYCIEGQVKDWLKKQLSVN